MTQYLMARQQADKTAWSRLFAVINDPNTSLVVIFTLIGLLATLALTIYLPSSAATAFLSAQLQ